MTQTRDDVPPISLLDDPVRRRIYDWVIAQARPVGREETAQALELTRALVTFHLDKLAAAGLLEADYRRLTGRVGPGAGRPARVYWRADRDFAVTLPARQYQRAAELFATALEGIGETVVETQLQAAGARLGEELGAASGGGAPRRRLLDALSAGGYEPHPVEHDTIRLRNCPYHALVESHRPLVCGTNLAYAQGIARAVGSTGLEPVLDPQPGYCCVAFVPRSAAPGGQIA